MARLLPSHTSSYPTPRGDGGLLSLQEEEATNLRDYWIVLLKYRWTILAFVLPMVFIATIALWWSTPLYTATATLHMENRSPNIMGVPESFTLAGNSLNHYYQTQLNLLKSRSLAARVIQELELAQEPRFEAEAEGLLGFVRNRVGVAVQAVFTSIQGIGGVKWLWERFIGLNHEPESPAPIFELGTSPDLIDRYLERLTLTPVDETELLKVSFSSVDAAFSKDVVNTHVSTFIRSSLLTRFELTAEARQFLLEKLTELKTKLQRSEERLNQFRKAHPIVALDKGENFVVDRLRGINTDLTQARSRRIELESLNRSLQQRGNQLLSQFVDNPLIRAMKEQISALEVEKARLSTLFKPTYAGVVALQQQINQTKGRMDQEMRQIIRSIASDYAAAKAKEEALSNEMERQRRSAMDLQEKAVEAAVLEREVESNRALYDNVLKRTKETDLTGNVPVSSVRVVDRADVPLLPDEGTGKRTLILSVLIGLLGGMGLAFLRHSLDNTLKTPEDVERFLHLPTLGLVPDVERLDGRGYGFAGPSRLPRPRGRLLRQNAYDVGETALAIADNPYSAVSESYQAICTALLYSQPDRSPRTILITSAQPKEGKSATAINVATTLAWSARSVLLIDADLRNGRCHRLLGLHNGKGLTEVITGNGNPATLIRKTSTTNLFLLSRGSTPPNPAQLLGSEGMGQMLATLATDFSFIIIDSAPLLPISDSVVLATQVDGVVLVARCQTVSRHLARQACDRLAYVRANVLGVVLNGLDIHSPEYKDYKHSFMSYYTGYPTDDV